MGLTNDQVIDRWVEYNEQKTYRRPYAGSGSVTFSGPVLHSYRTGIGCYYEGYVLLNSRRYGVTTARHVNQAAWGSHYPNFRVPNIKCEDRLEVLENVKHLQDVMQTAIEEAKRLYRNRDSLDLLPHYLRSPIEEAHKQLRLYLKLTETRVEGLVVDDLEDILEQVVTHRDIKWAAYMDPKAVAKRERSQARKLAKQLLLGASA